MLQKKNAQKGIKYPFVEDFEAMKLNVEDLNHYVIYGKL